MADTAVVAKPMAASTPDKTKKKKRKSTSSTKEKKAESSNKDVMELEEPVSKPKRKFDEQTKPITAKGKGKEDEPVTTDRRKRQRLSITAEKAPAAAAPSLACFPNAPPPLSSLHNKEGGISFGLWENKGILRTKKMLVAETDKMLYLGQPIVRNPSKYYILAVDRSTNKAKMVPVAQLYHMQQQIKGYTPTLPTDADDDERSYGEQRRSLIERFGSKKKRSQVHSMRANQITTGSVSHADDIMSSLNEKASQKAANDAQLNTELYPELPPYNAFTDAVAEIYPLGDIIPFDFLNQIDPTPLVKASKDPTLHAATAKRYTNYIAERVKDIKGLLPGEQERQGRVLALVGALMKLRSFIMEKRGMFKIPEAKESANGILSEEAMRHFLPLFADGEGWRFRSSTLGTTRLTTYIIILLLHASRFRLDVGSLTTALALETKKCQQYLLSIGCKSTRKAADTSSKADEEEVEEAVTTSGPGVRLFSLRAPLRLPDKTRIRGKAK